MTIVELAEKYKPWTDKGEHSYCPLYDELFLPFKEKSINLLEVGVRKGGSLLMWRDYFTNGNIFAIDNLPCGHAEGERIQCLQRDAYCMKSIEEIEEMMKGWYSAQWTKLGTQKFDIIIDDGSHQLDHQIFFVKHYPRLIAKGGIMIVEDIKNLAFYKMLLSFCSKEAICEHHFGKPEDRKFDTLLTMKY